MPEPKTPTTDHPTGLPRADRETRCGDCAWFGGGSCTQARSAGLAPEIFADTRGCALWEPFLESCDPCGACCREAFDSVPVEHDEAVREAHPDMVVDHDDGWRDLRRVGSPTGVGTWCAALRKHEDGPFRCVIYPSRPRACAELERGDEACLEARRRVGLSPWPPGVRPDGPWIRAGRE